MPAIPLNADLEKVVLLTAEKVGARIGEVLRA
jgi:hypothetical protein